jgi:hypothetical protein
MMMLRVAMIAGLAACGAGGADSPNVDGNTGDGPTGCVVGIDYEPVTPIAVEGAVIRATASVQNSPGLHTYQWFLSKDGGPNMTPDSVNLDNSMVQFPVESEGIYRVRFRIEDPNCEEASVNIDVNGQGVGVTNLRAHVVAPPSENRPPLDKVVEVEGGDSELIEDLQLAQATLAGGTVTLGGTPVAAYLKFMPTASAEAAVETYSNALGDYAVQVRPEPHDVLVIPTTPNVAPQLASWSPGQSTIVLQDGTQVTGTVRDPANAAIANATVQLSIAGIPSTIATTDGAGLFTLLAPPSPGTIRFEVTPPPATGLPRLVAESNQFTIAGAVTVRYAAALTTRDLANTEVRRGSPLPNATVTLVGTLADAGTITAGTAVAATGEARFTAVTNGSGDLPAMRAPAAPLVAVIFPGAAGDHAVTSIDLTTAVPATINAAATIERTATLTSSTGTALPGAVLDAVPRSALALAGAPTIRRTAGANGLVSIDLAPNALYDLRLTDPNGNRGALRVIENTTNASVTGSLALTKATQVQGLVIGAAPIPGAIVQFLCVQCTGLERSRPIAEGVTGIDGRFQLAVPDPD